MQQNGLILKLNFDKIEFFCKTWYPQNLVLYVYLSRLNISNVKFHLNFQKKKKNLSGKICIDLNIANVEIQKQGHFI